MFDGGVAEIGERVPDSGLRRKKARIEAED